MDASDLSTDQILFTLAAILAAVAVAATFLEHRRKHRRDLDKVGIMPWNFIQVIAFLGTIVALGIALKG